MFSLAGLMDLRLVTKTQLLLMLNPKFGSIKLIHMYLNLIHMLQKTVCIPLNFHVQK